MKRREAVIALLVALVVGVLVIDRGTTEPDRVVSGAPTDAVDPASGEVIPVSSGVGALSSTWFCAGGTADSEAFANHVITVLNPLPASVTVTVTAYGGHVLDPPANAAVDALDPDAEPDEDEDEEATESPAPTVTGPVEPVTRSIEVNARSRVRLALSDLVTAPIASALVEASTGGLVVEHEVSSIHGEDSKPCATSASDTWHFAWGTTARDARELLVLFNPFPDDAVIDGRFSTEDGVREPLRFDGLVVPGKGTLAIDLGDDVTRRDQVSATLQARTGRVVADRIVRVNAGETRRGLTVQLGVPEPQDTWIFPDGFTSDEVREQFVVYNPTDSVAEVSLEFLVERPDENGIPEPIDLSIAPGTHAVVDVTADGRIAPGLAHSTIVRSENGIPIVVERVLASATSTRKGMTVTTGSPFLAETWAFAAGAAGPADDEWLVLVNPDPVVVAQFDVIAVVGGQEVPVSELQGLAVEANDRLAIRISERIQRDDLALVVRATEPLVVERGRYRVGSELRGMSNSIGVPTPDVLVRPGDPVAVEIDADLGDVDAPDVPDDDDVPQAPDDVELPEPDETITPGDPDAEADVPGGPPTSEAPGTSDPGADEPPSTTTTAAGVPDTAPAAEQGGDGTG